MLWIVTGILILNAVLAAVAIWNNVVREKLKIRINLFVITIAILIFNNMVIVYLMQ